MIGHLLYIGIQSIVFFCALLLSVMMIVKTLIFHWKVITMLSVPTGKKEWKINFYELYLMVFLWTLFFFLTVL